MKPLQLLLSVVLSAGGCSSDRSPNNLNSVETHAIARTVESAMDAFSAYEERGAIPGLSNGDRFDLETPAYDFSAPDDLPFPQKIEFKLRKKGESGILFMYVLVRKNPEQQWRLDEAWKMDNSQNRVRLIVPERVPNTNEESP